MNREEMLRRLEVGEDPLELSIEKWEDLVENPWEKYGGINCALCETTSECRECPVKMAGFSGCSDTPYKEFEEERDSIDPDEDRLSELAQAEVDFLKSLRPKKPKDRTEEAYEKFCWWMENSSPAFREYCESEMERTMKGPSHMVFPWDWQKGRTTPESVKCVMKQLIEIFREQTINKVVLRYHNEHLKPKEPKERITVKETDYYHDWPHCRVYKAGTESDFAWIYPLVPKDKDRDSHNTYLIYFSNPLPPNMTEADVCKIVKEKLKARILYIGDHYYS